MTEEPHPGQFPGTMATRLEHLFETMHPASGPYTNDYVAAEIQKQSGVSMHPSYIWRLRTGARRNPHHDKVAAIARFFNVPPAYFYDDEFAGRIDKQLALMAATRDLGMSQFAARASELSEDEASEAVLRMADHIRAVRERADENSSSL